jgi:hypothetical protein
MARQAAVRRVDRYIGCYCGHLKKQWLDERVLQRVGERSTTHTVEAFRNFYHASPCQAWPHYREVSHDMGIPIPGGGKDSSDEDDSDDEESDDEEIGDDAVVPVPHAVVPRFNSTNENSTSNKPTTAVIANAATAATDSSKKRKTRGEERGLDHRPAWLVRMEQEKLLSSSSVDKADHPRTPASVSRGKPQSTVSRSANSMSWGKPQSTVSRSANSMSWGKPQSTEPTTSSSNEWTYRTFKSKNW